ncbi:MAG: TIGR02266 family protein [Myxococcales bacterium]|nr:MAG: TIGR02266 family protein [Myxococcales bacterium]
MSKNSTNERRRSKRGPIELKMEYQSLNTFFSDYTHNISRGGTFIRTERPLPIGTLFHFILTIPNVEEPLRLKGRVHWRLKPKDCKDGQEPGMGIGFVYDDEVQRQRTIALVETLMTNSLGPLLYDKLVASHLRPPEE